MWFDTRIAVVRPAVLRVELVLWTVSSGLPGNSLDISRASEHVRTVADLDIVLVGTLRLRPFSLAEKGLVSGLVNL